MIKALINGVFIALISVATFLTQPLADLLTHLFPNITSYSDNIYNFLNLIINTIGWFWNLIPPITKTTIVGVLGFYIALQPLKLAMSSINRGLDLIKRINIFSGK